MQDREEFDFPALASTALETARTPRLPIIDDESVVRYRTVIPLPWIAR